MQFSCLKKMNIIENKLCCDCFGRKTPPIGLCMQRKADSIPSNQLTMSSEDTLQLNSHKNSPITPDLIEYLLIQ